MIHFKRVHRTSIIRKMGCFSLALFLSVAPAASAVTAQAAPENTTVMENCGAYLFT